MSEGVTDVSVEEEKFFDTQVQTMGAFALIVLIVAIILLYVFTNSLNGIGPALQTAAATVTNRIQATFPGGFQKMQDSVNLIKNQATDVLNQVNEAVSVGAQKSLNVVLSVGQQVINSIQSGFQNLLNLLGETGGDIIQFFSNTFQPVVQVAQILGTILIDALTVLQANLLPIITLVQQLLLAIATIGQKF
jgi:hypothetical protein